MIFVTVGTTDFDLLIAQMDLLAPDLSEEVVCQIGQGSFVPRNCRSFRFAPSLESYVRGARLVVSHGGLGSVTETVRLGKPLIGVSNPDRYDRHQDDLLTVLESSNCLLWCRSLDDLASTIERAFGTSFRLYVEPPCTIHEVIDEFFAQQVPVSRMRRIRDLLVLLKDCAGKPRGK